MLASNQTVRLGVAGVSGCALGILIFGVADFVWLAPPYHVDEDTRWDGMRENKKGAV